MIKVLVIYGYTNRYGFSVFRGPLPVRAMLALNLQIVPCICYDHPQSLKYYNRLSHYSLGPTCLLTGKCMLQCQRVRKTEDLYFFGADMPVRIKRKVWYQPQCYIDMIDYAENNDN